MRVVLPTSGDPWVPRASGILTYVSGLGRYLSRQGIEVEFLVAGNNRSDGLVRAVHVTDTTKRELAYARHLRRFLQTHPFTPGTVLLANSEMHAWACREWRASVPIVLVAHGPTYPTLRKQRPFAALLFRLFVERRIGAIVSQIVAIDAETESYFSQSCPDTPICRIPTGVDLEGFQPLDRNQCKAMWNVRDRPMLLYVGRFAREKRLDLALEAFRCLLASSKNSVFLVAGNGPLEGSIRRRAANLGDDRARVLGLVNRSDLPSLYSAADAVILTSAIEQSPTVAIESLACGTPVFATAVGELPILLSDGRLGSIIDGSPQEMADTIHVRFPENQPERNKYETARRNAAASRSWNGIGPSVVEVLHAALSSS